MRLKAIVSGLVSAAFTSRRRRDLMRRLQRRKGPPMLDYFHQVDDPYSHLLVQRLAALKARYGATIRPWLASPPDDAAAPERGRLQRYALGDAALVAPAYGVTFPEGACQPSAAATRDAAGRLAAALSEQDFAGVATAVGEALWTGAALPAGGWMDPTAALAAGDAERKRLGHYLGGMIHLEGEWYWGVDRLHHLEERLAALGFDAAPGAPPIAPFRDLTLDAAPRPGHRPVIDVWFSFRSPYSWIAFPRVRRLAQHYGAELRLRYILPMVMRGLPVPREKSRYIMLDTKREADRVGLPFGKVLDPVGKGVERSIAVLHHAVPLGLGEAFAERILRATWSEAADLTDDGVFYGLAAEAGLSKAQVDAALADESWREAAEINRQALFDAGLWGAPTYRVDGGDALWGQDRLWALERDVRRAVGAV